MNIRILPVAQREIDKAAEWYERERDGLGFTFLDRVDQGLDQWRREWDSDDPTQLKQRNLLIPQIERTYKNAPSADS